MNEPYSPGRRHVMKQLGLAGLAGWLGLGADARPAGAAGLPQLPAPLLPPAVRPGQCVALTAPAGAVFYPERIEHFAGTMNRLGYEVLLCESLHQRHGYFSGKDEARAAELNGLFRNPNVHAIVSVRGGWGSSRILPLLDYEAIRQHPKILMGYSDITALLLGIHAQTGLVTFHGPMGYSEWSDFSCQHFVHVFQEAETEMLMPPGLAMGDEGTVTIVPGKAQGLLMGGNLTILTTLVGTPYMPDLRGKILFVEEVNEEAYRIDRMLTHLKLAGVFDGLAGFVFGKCINCEPETPEKALSFWEVLDEVIKPLGVPAFYGSVIGHLADQFIIPIGIEAAIDASNGSITLLTPSVRG